MTSGARVEPEPMYAWQVLDDDGRWGTISCFLATPANFVTGSTEKGHNLVLCHRNEVIVRGPMRQFAETHRAFGKPVRLHRFIPDPDFKPEELP